ncbi:MAG: efflux RND transporter periplasmic adaptor subunit [Desulfuromonadales bacterium]
MNNKRFLLAVLLIGLFSGAVFLLRNLPGESTSAPGPIDKNRRVPVEVVAIEHGPIALHRTFSGTLEARAEFVVAPKVAGRVERLTVNIADPVTRGQVVGELDSEEYVQAVAQARADLAVSKANLAEAKNALEITRRELDRIETLRQRGVASESQLDAVKANELAKQAELEVAEAQAVRAEASVKTAEIRLGYTRITAGWSGGEEQRVVAERFPMTGVVFVTERDYARLQPGQSVTLTTDAFPGEEFLGHIERIAPVFKQSTRQARVELSIDNPGQRLKPGMFVRATVVLARAENATIIPEQALTKRNDRTGLFLVSPDGQTVTWHEVSVAIRDGDRVQIDQDDLSGRVVILGQQLLENGSAISIASQPSTQDKTDSSPEQK